MTPPIRSRRRILKASRSTGAAGSGLSGAACPSERCGRCSLWWFSYSRSTRQEMSLIPDQGAVEQFPAASADPPLHDRVRSGSLHRTVESADVHGVQNLIEGSGELGVAVADQELDRRGLAVQLHQRVPSLLGHPRAGGVWRYAQNANALGGVLDHGKDVGGRAIEQVDGEEIG